MQDLLSGLTAAQKEAVTSTEGHIRVIAGAGSGKTKALTRRYAYLVTELGILPENILCVTFTNKAANEMRQRIRGITGDNDTGYINTFHGFCVSVLHEDAYAVGYPKNFIVLDNSDYGETYGVCLAHFNWLCSHCRADKRNTRALILELTWSTNEMKIVCEKELK